LGELWAEYELLRNFIFRTEPGRWTAKTPLEISDMVLDL